MANKSISTSVDEETHAALAAEAKAQDRTFSAQVARVLRQWAQYEDGPGADPVDPAAQAY